MTFTVEEAQANLARIIAQAEAGEEVYLGREAGHPTVRLLPIATEAGRLTHHPDLIGSTTTHDPAAQDALTILDHESLVQPLPPEEWGDLADR